MSLSSSSFYTLLHSLTQSLSIFNYSSSVPTQQEIQSFMMDFSEAFKDLMRLLAPAWIAFCIGMVAGWAWRPRWASLAQKVSKSPKTASASSSPTSVPSPFPSSPKKCFGSAPCLYSLNYNTFDPNKNDENDALSELADPETKDVHNSQSPELVVTTKMCDVISEEDLEHLYDLVEMRDGGPPWIPMMQKSTPDMSYQAWRRDLDSGLPQYCSKTVYENVSPELVRDFFWDDEFRLKWDDMLAHASILEDCETTGTIVVRWVRKFPFFCSDREYIIARRIWVVGPGGVYYCVTKGIPNAPVPRHDKPRRVDLYYSSWCIRLVASRSGGNACEVILFHHEDMGIPWEIAKLAVKQGMWGTVRKIHRGIRAYQRERSSNEAHAQLSRYVFMARINTKVNPERLRSCKNSDDVSEEPVLVPAAVEKSPTASLPKFVIFGGAFLIACSLDKALLAKAVIFGIGRKFANISRGMRTENRIR